MLGPRCKEITTSTGNGDLTLGGALAGFAAINSVFSNDATNAGIPFEYMIWSRSTTEWECGIGRMSTASNFKRVTVLSNSSGSTSAITLSAGTKYVAATPCGYGMRLGTPAVTAGATTKVVPYSTPGCYVDSSTTTLTASRAYMIPHCHDFHGKIDALLVETTSGAGGNAVGAIYTFGETGAPGQLLQFGAAVSLAAAGLKAMTFTSRLLPPGWYYLAVNTDATGATNTFLKVLAQCGTGVGIAGVMGLDGSKFPILSCYDSGTTTYTGTSSSFNDAPAGYTYQNNATGVNPWIGLRAA